MGQANLNRNRAGGFSLVELMLALALGLIVVTGIVQLFVGNTQTYNILNGQARLQENGRFALEFISRAAREAGYFGCANAQENIVWALTAGNVDNSNLTPEFDIRRPVHGVDNVAGSGDLGTYPTLTANSYIPANGIDADAVVVGTDVLAVRSMETPGWRLMQELFPTGANSNPRIVDTTAIQVGDIVMVSNCEQAAVFRVTGMPGGGGNTVFLQHAVAGGGLFSNQLANISSIGRTYQEDTLVGRVQGTFFFIAEGAGLDNQGNPPLALWQKVGRNAPVELVQGVEDLQVLYGIDTTLNDGIPNANEYVIADDLDIDDANVVSLRIMVTVNSVDAVTEDGQVLRRTFSKTILLRNADPEAA
ncbi:MAG: PilW family protein [Pseudomonadales bacterium]